MPAAPQHPPVATSLEKYALDAMILARCRRPLGHEMKNAVQGLYSGIEILNKAIENAGKSRIGPADCVPLLRRQLDSLQEALHRILEEVAPQPSEPAVVDLAALVRDLVRFLMSDAAVASVRMDLDAPSSPTAWARAPVVRRVLLGLLLDAIDAMRDSGGGALQIRISPAEARVSIELRDARAVDDSSAIPSEHARIDTASLRHIAANLVREENGEMELIAPGAAGCVVRITLPAR